MPPGRHFEMRARRADAAALAALALAVYANTLHADFTFDDQFAVVSNADVLDGARGSATASPPLPVGSLDRRVGRPSRAPRLVALAQRLLGPELDERREPQELATADGAHLPPQRRDRRPGALPAHDPDPAPGRRDGAPSPSPPPPVRLPRPQRHPPRPRRPALPPSPPSPRPGAPPRPPPRRAPSLRVARRRAPRRAPRAVRGGGERRRASGRPRRRARHPRDPRARRPETVVRRRRHGCRGVV